MLGSSYSLEHLACIFLGQMTEKSSSVNLLKIFKSCQCELFSVYVKEKKVCDLIEYELYYLSLLFPFFQIEVG